jgi:16S rRNA (guanine966-N2)-methyltransferase
VGAVVLDLYAGSGALGLEAVSRGASRVDLVESDRRAAQVIEANVSAVAAGLSDPAPVVAVHCMTVDRWIARAAASAGSGSSARYDVVFCDPPYSTPSPDLADVIWSMLNAGLLAADAVVVVERAHRSPDWHWPQGFSPLRDSAYGEAHLWVGAAEVGRSLGDEPGDPPSDSVAPC